MLLAVREMRWMTLLLGIDKQNMNQRIKQHSRTNNRTSQSQKHKWNHQDVLSNLPVCWGKLRERSRADASWGDSTLSAPFVKITLCKDGNVNKIWSVYTAKYHGKCTKLSVKCWQLYELLMHVPTSAAEIIYNGLTLLRVKKQKRWKTSEGRTQVLHTAQIRRKAIFAHLYAKNDKSDGHLPAVENEFQ